MSAEKKHDYHLVDPSPWPIYVSFSCLVLALGAVYYMHSDVSWGMYLGLALVIYGAYMWFRDVVIEAEHQGHHTPVVQIHHRYGMTLFIASEVMFFVAWFWAYFDVSLFKILIPAPLPNDGLTLVIKSSSANTLALSVFSINISTKSAPSPIP